MKTRFWTALLGAIFLLSLALCLLPRPAGTQAEIWVDGTLQRTVSLLQEQQFTINTPEGVNVITIRGGKLAVTQSDCPGGQCMAQGYRNSGSIVCLPHRLVIQFSGGADAVAG